MMLDDFLKNTIKTTTGRQNLQLRLSESLDTIKQSAQQCEKNSVELIRMKKIFETCGKSVEEYRSIIEEDNKQIHDEHNRILVRLFSIIDEMETDQFKDDSNVHVFLLRLDESLRREGFEKFVPLRGDPCDPLLHEVLDFDSKGDYPDNCIVQVIHRGYKQKGKIMRRAGVIMSKKECNQV